MDTIEVRGAKTHNLKNIQLSLPRNQLIVITGLSGSGKSSLAFDTLYAEGQRRYVESLSTYARQFLSVMPKPEVDSISGLSPAISIEQKTTSHNPRSTVGTITEIYDYLRLLYARVGTPHCPTHHYPLQAQTISQMIDQILQLPEDTKIMLLAPLVANRKGDLVNTLKELQAQGYVRVQVDGTLYELDDVPKLNAKQKHSLSVVIDRLVVKADIRSRLADSLETATQLSQGLVEIHPLNSEVKPLSFSTQYACPTCGYSLTELEPRLFSFNNPVGACSACDGIGVEQFFDPEIIVQQPSVTLAAGAIWGWDRRHPYYFNQLEALSTHYGFDLNLPYNQLPQTIQKIILYGSNQDEIDFQYTIGEGKRHKKTHAFAGVIPTFERRYRESQSAQWQQDLSRFVNQRPCESCGGSRLKQEARHVFINQKSLPEVSNYAIDQAFKYFQDLQLTGQKQFIAEKIVKEIHRRLQFLMEVGLSYLTLNRTADTLSGGEAQRIRLASQIGAGLVGVMYVLDEPSIGLHQRDNSRLLNTLTHLRDLGNTVIVVEHDQDAILKADYVVDMGPGAGVEGGHIVAEGTPTQIIQAKSSLTGQYLSGEKKIAVPKARKPIDQENFLIIENANGNNLQNVTLTLPLGLLTCITGVSGSGKSTLINHTLYPHAAHHLNKAGLHGAKPCDRILGLEHLDKVINIDQSPIGRTPRSNPATYTGLFTPIRELFAKTKEARTRGYQPGRFSFNVKGGRCEACEGDGVIKVEMHFLADLYVTCDVCKGKRYNEETLQIRYKGKNIHEILQLTVKDGIEFFANIPALARKLQTLVDVGLCYLSLGQSATTLSGGEAQRVKLAKELSRRDTGKTLYILDEPTTGLHFHDIAQLLTVLNRLQAHGNTIIVIEHNMDVIKTADWIVDLGPEGGSAGGTIIATGTPEHIAMCSNSYTGQFLKDYL